MKRTALIAAAIITAALAVPAAAIAHHKPGHTHGPPAWAGTPGGPNGTVPTEPAVDPPVDPPAGPGGPAPEGEAVTGAGTAATAAETPAVAPQAETPAKKPAGPQRCRKEQKVGFAVTGALASYAAPELAIDVTEANRHARDWIAEHGSSFDAAGASTTFEGVEDADGEGVVGLEDAAPGDLVELGGKLLRPKRGCEAETAVRVDRISVIRLAPVDPVVPEPELDPPVEP